jgi:hypothetical protein
LKEFLADTSVASHRKSFAVALAVAGVAGAGAVEKVNYQNFGMHETLAEVFPRGWRSSRVTSVIPLMFTLFNNLIKFK